MEIITLSQTRGILALYDGNKYVIYSTHYGVVAESKPIVRYINDENSDDERLRDIKIEFDICKWYGYWSLKGVITRGIKKIERAWDNEATIVYHEVEGAESHLKKRLVMSLEEY